MTPLALAFVLVAGLFVLVYATGFGVVDGFQRSLSSFFRGLRPLPWPVGVQEEDDERPCGKRGQPETGSRASRVFAIEGALIEELPGAAAASVAGVRRR